jgi:hypothetical protein
VQAGTGMGADSFGRKPYTARERVESLGADDRARTEFGHGPEVCARMVGCGRWARIAGPMLETSATFCDHLYQICKDLKIK